MPDAGADPGVHGGSGGRVHAGVRDAAGDDEVGVAHRVVERALPARRLTDLEVEHEEAHAGELWSFAYPLADGDVRVAESGAIMR